MLAIVPQNCTTCWRLRHQRVFAANTQAAKPHLGPSFLGLGGARARALDSGGEAATSRNPWRNAAAPVRGLPCVPADQEPLALELLPADGLRDVRAGAATSTPGDRDAL